MSLVAVPGRLGLCVWRQRLDVFARHHLCRCIPAAHLCYANPDAVAHFCPRDKYHQALHLCHAAVAPPAHRLYFDIVLFADPYRRWPKGPGAAKAPWAPEAAGMIVTCQIPSQQVRGFAISTLAPIPKYLILAVRNWSCLRLRY